MLNDIKRGQIYFADLGQAFGREQDGTRPVLILQNDTGNEFSPTTIVATITSSTVKKDLPTHIRIQMEELPKESIVLLEQIKTIDKLRLVFFIGTLDEYYMRKIDKALAISLGITNRRKDDG